MILLFVCRFDRRSSVCPLSVSPCSQHNIYEMMSGMLRKLVIHKPKDPLAFMMAALQQPVQQVRKDRADKQQRANSAADARTNWTASHSLVCDLARMCMMHLHRLLLISSACWWLRLRTRLPHPCWTARCASWAFCACDCRRWLRRRPVRAARWACRQRHTWTPPPTSPTRSFCRCWPPDSTNRTQSDADGCWRDSQTQGSGTQHKKQGVG